MPPNYFLMVCASGSFSVGRTSCPPTIGCKGHSEEIGDFYWIVAPSYFVDDYRSKNLNIKNLGWNVERQTIREAVLAWEDFARSKLIS